MKETVLPPRPSAHAAIHTRESCEAPYKCFRQKRVPFASRSLAAACQAHTRTTPRPPRFRPERDQSTGAALCRPPAAITAASGHTEGAVNCPPQQVPPLLRRGRRPLREGSPATDHRVSSSSRRWPLSSNPAVSWPLPSPAPATARPKTGYRSVSTATKNASFRLRWATSHSNPGRLPHHG